MQAENGITINNQIHTAHDLDLVYKPSESEAENPEPKRLTEDIPGRDGMLDYSDYADGVLFYENRPVSYVFFCCGTPAQVRETIGRLNAYHGRTVTVVEDDDPDYSLTGTASVSVTGKAPYGNYAYITLSLDAQPYRRRLTPTIVNSGDVSGKGYIEVENGIAPVQLTVRVNGLSGGETSTKAVRISVESSRFSEIIQTVGEDTVIRTFLMKGGRQRIVIETLILRGNDWRQDATLSANVTVSYTEGKF